MQILLIEDNGGDATLVKLGFKDTAPTATISWQTTAEAGLRALEKYHDLYDLILLDLNLPKMSGAQFVAHVATRPETGKIPIMILSSSPASQVVGAPHGDRPLGYITKPSDLAGYRSIAKYLHDCWTADEWTESGEIKVRFKRFD
ncbi:hypothetical protein AEAC466_20220 [Asticcacaulis sp. AC466]|uniref:response regulator n=1 Tax=Asticcacaulis sp. AC466 TaxID=1282362 RepID=UPI0003C3EFEF|nr:response regulator [Asticcacaulis sp. AC466]ESQ81750.1 hypothetical protein AEAC466_20220 [Asticcacaulis sp. AC466]